MNHVDIKELNKSIADMWEKSFGTNKLFNIYPSFLPEVKELEFKRILYVGLNPAYQNQEYLRYEGGEIKDSIIFKLAKENHISRTPGSQYYYSRFFKPIHEFHNILNDTMVCIPDHYDLFPFRETDSKCMDIHSLIYDDDELSFFTKLCLANLINYIRITRPILVIVNNSMSSSIVKNFFSTQLFETPEPGIYSINLDNVKTSFFLLAHGNMGDSIISLKRSFLQLLKIIY